MSPHVPLHQAPQTPVPSIDASLKSFLGADYQDYARLKLAILGAKQYATGEVKTQPEVVKYLAEVTGVNSRQYVDARTKIAYVAQPDSKGHPGRR